MEEVKKPPYRYCMVPQCKNTTVSTPDKVFFRIPREENLRKKWCKMMKRDNISVLSVVFCCEDHFIVSIPNLFSVDIDLVYRKSLKKSLKSLLFSH